MGDILVYVNDTCVLGFTHHEMVNVFQSIQPGETVTLEVCRGYPLPFDPNDPNTEVVTTIAVDGLSNDPDKARILMDFNMDGNYNFLDISDTSGAVGGSAAAGPSHATLSKLQQSGSIKSDGSDHYDKPEILNIAIVKGAAMGFGFTIADSAYGQKVKKILDSNCCTKLLEGDYLLAINNINVKHMSHSEVVQVLKHCPKGQEAVLKIQRGHFLNGVLSKGNRLRRSGDSNRFGTLPNGSKDSKMGLFRSKTPTADLYSTQPKEILPQRPKTPLVDTRTRAKTPSGDLQQEIGGTADMHGANGTTNDELDKNDDNKSIPADTKSNNSLADHDSINNDIPYMDPFPKLVSSLSERLADATLNAEASSSLYHPVEHSRLKHFATSQTDLNYEQQLLTQQQHQQQQHQDYYSSYNGGYQLTHASNGYGAYSPPSPLPIMAPVPTYHQDTCYCYECQDYGRHQQEYMMQPQYQYSPSSGQASRMNVIENGSGPGGRNQKRINDYMIDRRKAGFSPLETHAPLMSPPLLQHQHPQQQPHQYWKYGQPSPGSRAQQVLFSDLLKLMHLS